MGGRGGRRRSSSSCSHREFYSPREDPYPKSEWLDFLAHETRSTTRRRVFSVEGILFPDTAGVRPERSEDVDSLYIQRYWRYIRSFVSYGIEDRFTATSFAESAPGIGAIRCSTCSASEYVIFGADSQVDFPLGGDAQYSVAYKDDTVQILENTHALPRAFVVHDAQFVASEVQRFAPSAVPGPSGFRTIPYRCRVSIRARRPWWRTPTCPRRGSVRATAPATAARIVERSTTSMTIDVAVGCAGLLV